MMRKHFLLFSRLANIILTSLEFPEVKNHCIGIRYIDWWRVKQMLLSFLILKLLFNVEVTCCNKLSCEESLWALIFDFAQ
jgi:hypothetical protein